MIPLQHVLVLSALLFSLGVYGVLARRNAVLILMSVELMLNAVNINFIAFAVYLAPDQLVGLVFAIFVIVVAAAEAGLALAIIVRIYRNEHTANVDEVDLLKW
ncbi:MAG TPA: NADH-quinone oxidoreductase subunit NuoK [Dehalococcoidia bacterium]|jgi:NADH:ubiquinone oxidoreductase subunit K|nr:NADH-quinone oxidoreductase subunit NuoK [Dehalococcoidia bacterium]